MQTGRHREALKLVFLGVLVKTRFDTGMFLDMIISTKLSLTFLTILGSFWQVKRVWQVTLWP